MIFATLLQIQKFIKMKYTIKLSGVALVLFLAACSSQPNQSEILKQANTAHLEAIALAEDLEDQLKSIREKQTDPASIAKADSIASLLHLWKEGVLEVPGFAHEHEHDHDHGDHKHKPAPQMTDESMLEYQMNAKKAVEDLGKSLRRAQPDSASAGSV